MWHCIGLCKVLCLKEVWHRRHRRPIQTKSKAFAIKELSGNQSLQEPNSRMHSSKGARRFVFNTRDAIGSTSTDTAGDSITFSMGCWLLDGDWDTYTTPPWAEECLNCSFQRREADLDVSPSNYFWHLPCGTGHFTLLMHPSGPKIKISPRRGNIIASTD